VSPGGFTIAKPTGVEATISGNEIYSQFGEISSPITQRQHLADLASGERMSSELLKQKHVDYIKSLDHVSSPIHES